MQLPEYLSQGEPARLLPVIADTRKEQRVTSVLLSVFSVVPDFAGAVLSIIGHRLGKRSTINTYTEVVLKKGENADKDRPDGLIEIHSGKSVWSGLVEAKIGSATLDQAQIERYLHLARNNNVDAVITISNQFATRPTFHPVQISKSLTRYVQLFHLSWTAILTEAVLLHENSAITDPEQAFLLRELVRFLSHESVGVSGYTSMPSDWKGVLEHVQIGARLSPRGPDIEHVVTGWHQEIRDLSLMMGRILGRRVEVRLTKAQANNQETRLKNDINKLCRDSSLSAQLRIPDAASDLNIVSDLKTRTIRVSMRIDAPSDRVRASARVRWLLRQLDGVDSRSITVRVIWPSRASDAVFSLDAIREDGAIVERANPGAIPRAFEVILTTDNGRRFVGRRTFIEDLEAVAPEYYDRIGQHLKSWRPSPPKPKISAENSEIQTDNPQKSERRMAPGNDYLHLLEIPDYLRRV